MNACNYTRYAHTTAETYQRQRLSYDLYKYSADKVLVPLIHPIPKKHVLEIGLGTGYYTAYFLQQACDVIGGDINPHLGKHLSIPIIAATADNFEKMLQGQTFDVVASFWMTEYLPFLEVRSFVEQSLLCLKPSGLFLTTFVTHEGWGKFYQTASRLQGIDKFTYSLQETQNFPPISLSEFPDCPAFAECCSDIS